MEMHVSSFVVLRGRRRLLFVALLVLLGVSIVVAEVWLPGRPLEATARPEAEAPVSVAPAWSRQALPARDGVRHVLTAPGGHTTIEVVIRRWQEDVPGATDPVARRDALFARLIRWLEQDETLRRSSFRRLPVSRLAEYLAYRVRYVGRSPGGEPVQGTLALVLPAAGAPLLLDARTNGHYGHLNAALPFIQAQVEHFVAGAAMPDRESLAHRPGGGSG
ncbi:hypothetical protein GQ464_001470 [Rhodocaloribacter litoris]|uniref:hypothetical protein n=1 Tax=Rhodocaloribacter litoris TaxID=2558931 RepID=UPI001422E555|nr:hypothetical protein [Rhodocaloribacter litoris]QXD15642.1 hypothetical protein GQ464_001470 [Rhodocaloribacter litoris]